MKNFGIEVYGLAMMIIVATVLTWHIVDYALIMRFFHTIDIFLILFMILTIMVAGVILFTVCRKEYLADLGRWLDDLDRDLRRTSWPLHRDMLQVVGERLVGLYPKDMAWFLYALLPGYMVEGLPWGLREGKYLRSSSSDSSELEDQVDGFVRRRMEEYDSLDAGDGAEVIEGEEGEIAIFLSTGRDVGLGLAVSTPQEKVWRGGEWSKRQKMLFVRKAFDQLCQRMRALQAEWN